MAKRREQSETPDPYDAILDRAAAMISGVDQQIQSDRLDAADLWRSLSAHPPDRRRMLIANSRRYQTVGLVEEILLASAATWSAEPAGAEELARLALEVVDHLDRERYGEALLHDLAAQAWSYVANTRRIRGDLTHVEPAFRAAEEHLVQGTGDAFEEARLLDLRASFARDRRAYGQAAELLDRVSAIHRAVDDRHMEGRTLVSMAKLLREASGDVDGAIELLERASELIDAEREPFLAFALKKNLALYLSEAGRPAEAYALLPETQQIDDGLLSQLDHLRVLWIEGLVLQALGQPDRAAGALERARDGFLDEEITAEAALVSLDLAALELELGRLDEARTLAAHTLKVFGSLDVAPEALVALTLVHQATERSAALEVVQKAVRQLRRQHLSAGPQIFV